MNKLKHQMVKLFFLGNQMVKLVFKYLVVRLSFSFLVYLNLVKKLS